MKSFEAKIYGKSPSRNDPLSPEEWPFIELSHVPFRSVFMEVFLGSANFRGAGPFSLCSSYLTRNAALSNAGSSID